MSNPIATAAAFAFIGYVGYIAISSTPIDVMDRTCAPAFVWTGSLVSAGAKVFAPTAQTAVDQSFARGYDSCRVFVWNVAYSKKAAALDASK